MVRILVLILLYIAISMVTILNEQLILFISETVLFIGLLLVDYWRISKRQIDADFVLRRRTKRLRYTSYFGHTEPAFKKSISCIWKEVNTDFLTLSYIRVNHDS